MGGDSGVKCKSVIGLCLSFSLAPVLSCTQVLAIGEKSAHVDKVLLAALPITAAPMTKLSLPPIEREPAPNIEPLKNFDIYGEVLKRINQRLKTKVTAADLLERGRVYALKSDFASAIKDLTKALSMKKDLDDAYKLRGYCYSSINKEKEAEQDYVTYLQHKPKDVPIWIALGACYDKDRQPQKAIEAFNHAISLTPKEATFYAFKADVYGRSNEFEKANAAVDEGLKVDPKSRTCLFERAFLKELRKDKDGALKDLDALIAEYPDFIQARKERATIYEDQAKYQKALEEYNELIDLITASAAKMVDGAVKKAEQRDLFGGAMAVSAALAFYPEKVFFLRKRSEAYRLLRKYDEAMEDADNAVTLAPSNPLGFMQRGYVEFSMERVDDSIKDFNKVLELDPEEDTANWGRGFAYCLKGDYKNAAADFDRYGNSPTVDMYVKYCFVYRALMLKLCSQDGELPALYEKAAKKLDHKEWPYPFLEYLSGKITEEQLTKTADNNDKQTELHCFLALNAMADKNQTRAKDEFRWVLDNGNKDFFEYTLSIALIKKL